jgi:hypothetical protein
MISFYFPYSSGCAAGGGATGLLPPNAGTGAGLKLGAGALLKLGETLIELPPSGALPKLGCGA